MIAARRSLLVLLGLAGVFAVALALGGLLVVASKAAIGLPSPFDGAFAVLLFLVQLVLTALLFLAIPQALVLGVFGVTGRAPYLLAGAFAGWMFLFVSYVQFRWNQAAVAAQSVAAALGSMGDFLLSPATLFHGFAAATRPGTLALLMAVGAAICLFGWRTNVYRLPGVRGRDWEGRILGARPPYAG